MEIGFIGLGRMGRAMAQNLVSKGHQVIVYDLSSEAVASVVAKGAKGAASLMELANLLQPPRLIWIMVPAGRPVDEVLFGPGADETGGLFPLLASDDTVIDGGNSHYKDSVRRTQRLKEKGVQFLDAGTSGGLEGAKEGLCIMIGGPRSTYERAETIFAALARPGGYCHVGESGAGHFVKMVHNGVEYALLQAYGEGLQLLKEGPYPIDLKQVSHLWNQGSVVRSWLLELLEGALDNDPELTQVMGHVGGGETGIWAVEAALEHGVPFSMTSLALFMRFSSRQESSFSAKVVAALRQEFGGHQE